LARFRQDLLEPIQAVVTLSAVLLQEAQDRPEDFLADLRRMHDAAKGFLAFVEHALDASRLDLQGTAFEANLRQVRHDLGNRLNQVSGFCQLLMLREEMEFFGAFLGDLKRVHEVCQECERKLLRYRHPGPAATSQEPAADLVREMVSQGGDAVPSVQLLEVAGPRGEGGDLLIVDDNAIGREVLKRLLRHQGHATWEAENGPQALRMLEEQAFDVVLLDILMPGMSGFDVLEHLKAHPRLCRCAVLVISGLEEVHGVVRCIEMGAEDYLMKPINQVLLQARINSCLQKRRLRQRELEQFFPPEVARQLIRKPELLAEGREADVTVLFCDIRKFSHISEDLGPSKTVQWVSAVMEVLSECVLRHHGVVVDFVGDELMAMWGAPEEQPDHARLACRAALDMVARLPKLNQEWEALLGEPMSFGIGINSGPARVGNTGTRRKFKYGPLGNTVNLASRVQGATKYLKTGLLITGDTRKQLDAEFAVRRLAQVQAVNIETPVDLFELVPVHRPHWSDVKPRYETALQLFEARHLMGAAEILGSLITQYGAQGPELALMARTMGCLLEPGKWKKVWDLPGK
jgi:adenylate cyclase